jgi:hypothetical protein
MRLDTRQARLDLHPEHLATLTQACRARIACLAGTAWITIDGDPRDVVLDRGESFVVDSNANVVVAAIHGPASVVVSAPLSRNAAPCDRPARRWPVLPAWLQSTLAHAA